MKQTMKLLTCTLLIGLCINLSSCGSNDQAKKNDQDSVKPNQDSATAKTTQQSAAATVHAQNAPLPTAEKFKWMYLSFKNALAKSPDRIKFVCSRTPAGDPSLSCFPLNAAPSIEANVLRNSKFSISRTDGGVDIRPSLLLDEHDEGLILTIEQMKQLKRAVDVIRLATAIQPDDYFYLVPTKIYCSDASSTTEEVNYTYMVSFRNKPTGVYLNPSPPFTLAHL